jgi:hypothetical protein
VTITESLKVMQSAPPDRGTFSVTLACGFTPLHLQTFLAAHLQQALPDHKVRISTGLYGNLVGTLEGVVGLAPDGVVIALEWADLDRRLDFRSAGGWGRNAATDIVSSARPVLDRVSAAIALIPLAIRIEHRVLKVLFESTGARAVDFDFAPTAKNGPLQEFFAGVLGKKPAAAFQLKRPQFDKKCPALYHTVRDMRRAEAHG